MRQFTFIISLLLTGLVISACGGADNRRISSQENGDVSAGQTEEVAQTPIGDPDAGKELFTGTCAACHGPEGKGVQGLGKDMTSSEFIAGKTDTELIEFIKKGRDPSDPLNTTGVAMPPKGGNPSLDDGDLQDIVAFIRSIHQ